MNASEAMSIEARAIVLKSLDMKLVLDVICGQFLYVYKSQRYIILLILILL